MLNFSCTFQIWGLFLHLRIQNCSNGVILQLLALKWTLTNNQDIRAKFVLFGLSQRFWFWNPLICFGLGDHKSNPHLWSIDGVQNLNSWDQNLRFIHLIGISSGLFSKLHQDFSLQVQMNSHKCVGTWSYTGSLIQPTVLIRCLPFPPTVPICHSYLPFPSTILTKKSQLPFLTTYLPFFISLL